VRYQIAIRERTSSVEALGSILSKAPLNSDSKETLEALLLENITPFWMAKAIDERHGGYHLNHDITGNDLGECRKFVISQARMTWFFSALSRSRYGTSEHRTAARHGYLLLANGFHDKLHGGYFWSIDPSNAAGSNTDDGYWQRKDLCAQAFVLYALSEYALATEDQDAAEDAASLYALLESRTHDPILPGYLELFERDWTPASAEVLNYHSSLTADSKSFSCHVHLLEALTTYYELNQEDSVRTTLTKLLDIICNRLFHGSNALLTNVHRRDWQPDLSHDGNHANYGHQLELIWMLLKVVRVSGKDIAEYESLFESIFAGSVLRGMDEKQGGFYCGGPYGTRAKNLSKVWWVQAESLLCCLHLYVSYQKEEYADCFNKTLQWIVAHQVDWENGEWFQSIDPTGKPAGLKADRWKAAYHSGRAVLHGLSLLDARRTSDLLRQVLPLSRSEP
jgi:mannobiose 2-epimerase